MSLRLAGTAAKPLSLLPQARAAHGIFVPQPGVKLTFLYWKLKVFTTREVPCFLKLKKNAVLMRNLSPFVR